jgi:arylsulfatase A-like enzyme
MHSKLFKDAQKLAVDPDYQLIFIHFAIPHAPRINKKWGLLNITQWGYFGNLELADQTFGILRKSMEEQGVWDNTVILATSDHQWRKSNRIDGKKDPRVPFILKLPGEKDGVVYKPDFNAALTKELLIGILKKEIKTYNDLTKWLNEQQKN